MKQAAVVKGRSFRFKCAIITAILVVIAIVVEAVVGIRDEPTDGTPPPTFAPTQDLEIRCAEEC
jgi:hypothetical protein